MEQHLIRDCITELHYCYGETKPGNESREPQQQQIAYGMCIPSTCSGEMDRMELLKEWQHNVHIDNVKNNGSRALLDADDRRLLFGDCTKSRHTRQWWEQPVPLLQFAFDMVLVGLISVATVLHWRRGGRSKSLRVQLLLSFSAARNMKKMVQMPKDLQSTITCMFGLRFLSMVWTLIGHSFIFVQAFLSNVDEFKDDLVDNFWNQWITNFTLSVDVFLVLSGTLTAYSWFRRAQQPHSVEARVGWTAWPYWLRFYRHRLVRLWPAYIYTLFAVTTRVSVTHYHPMWPPTDPAVQCPKHWLENVLFINSLTDNRCLPWTWYIGTEFIFYLLSPVFLLALRQSPVYGLSLVGAVSAASALANLITMLQYNFPPTQMLWKQPPIFSPDFIKHHLVIYIKPWYRIGPYLVGLVLGFVLAVQSVSPQRKRSEDARSFRFVWAGWAMACGAGFWSVFGLYPALQGWDWPLYHLFYGSCARTIFAIALGWLIYACHTGIGGPINWVLSLSPFLPLSVLSYSVYLFHMIPVVFTYMISPFPIHYKSKFYVLIHCVIQLAISYGFGMICTLLAELPALNIERILLSPKRELPRGEHCVEEDKRNGYGSAVDGYDSGAMRMAVPSVTVEKDVEESGGYSTSCADEEEDEGTEKQSDRNRH
uniref:Acyl_transf_3 domain-containing protein n=1 Tax=Globodera pallida TaxID=36090 RepID=A0A183BMS4_GLOPA